MDKDPFEEYLRQAEPAQQDLGYAWQTAVGLQAVDDLKPSQYLIDTAKRNIEGEISLAGASEIINSYYEENRTHGPERTEEADKVSVRIAQLLSERAFVFSPEQYLSIHKRLFSGIYDHAGKLRDYNISKKEWVLNGDTVLYGGASELRATLEYDFSVERDFSYKDISMQETIAHIARFISRLWQIHVFGEGNTRTTAVFLIKYLRTLGFDATNDTFAENAWYFRNALVRANYNDLKHGVHETTEFLELFLRNLLLGEHNELHNRYLHISGALGKQDIGSSKQDIQREKQDIQILFPYTAVLRTAGFKKKTVSHVESLFWAYGDGHVFGRGDVIRQIGLSPSASSELLKKLLACGVIETVAGEGKGRYRFSPSSVSEHTSL